LQHNRKFSPLMSGLEPQPLAFRRQMSLWGRAGVATTMVWLSLLHAVATQMHHPADQCDMHVVVGKACTNEAKVKLLPPPQPSVHTADGCCSACAAMQACGAWTFHADKSKGNMTGSCLLANASSTPGIISGATCGSKQPFPPPAPPPAPPPPLPPLPPAPRGLMVPSLTLERAFVMSDPTGFLRDPSSPIQGPDGVWHAWVVWVAPE
jgi:hypothetical protein